MTTPTRRRAAGMLLHPTSLPGPYGVGDLGPTACEWVDALADAGQTWWQILPLGPTGYGDSPYQCFSAFAGNPTLVSPELLHRDGLLTAAEAAPPNFPQGRVDYGPVIAYKNGLTARAFERFRSGAAPALAADFEAFRRDTADWLDDYALFMALKDARGGVAWSEWPDDLRLARPAALAAARRELAGAIDLHRFRQFLFFRQWGRLKAYANGRGVRVLGDAPIFVSGDSADVWANPKLFKLDADRRPTFVAGVPPDYFSETGQLWGNPLYDWDEAKRTGYAWWAARIRTLTKLVDWVRLDHFRGFAAAWHVPAGAATAQNGAWVPGAGADLFVALQKGLGSLPILAEDLGLITDDVHELRDRFGLAGMRILQFAFGGAVEDRFLPHNYEFDTVVYTGTHDNDTTLGWFRTITEGERDFVRRYLGRPDDEVVFGLIRLAWASVADTAIIPLQDLLYMGTEARMNTPGVPGGNWQWRLKPGELSKGALDHLGELTTLYARAPKAGAEEGKKS